MTKAGVVKFTIAIGIVLAIAYPIRQQVVARAAIEHNLINSLDANDAAALRLWQGSAESFVAMLYDRCMRKTAGDAQACTRYQQ
jgi:Tfp pilus assembly major pilin PilA